MVWLILWWVDFFFDGDYYGIFGLEEELELFGDVVVRESVLFFRMIIVLCLKIIMLES